MQNHAVGGCEVAAVEAGSVDRGAGMALFWNMLGCTEQLNNG